MTNRKSRRNVGLVGNLVGAAVLAVACGSPESREIAGWGASDESNAERIEHAAWQEILDAYVRPDEAGVNLVDYAALKESADDSAKLAAYLDELQGIDPTGRARDEQMAYWINLYNALTVRTVVSEYPVDSIKDIHEGLIPNSGPWQDVRARVNGRDLTLDDIEHGILRPIWRDPRIHYAVNCAAYGCPNLRRTAFTAANLEAQLQAGARSYVNDPRGVDFVDEDFIVLSGIYTWFVEDFGDSEEGVIAHLLEHAEADLASRLEGFAGAIDYEYDWSLNAP